MYKVEIMNGYQKFVDKNYGLPNAGSLIAISALRQRTSA